MKEQLNQVLQANLVYPNTANLQQRGIADLIEDQCNQIIQTNFNNVTPARSRRSIEDITVEDTYVDHKTSDAALDFKMPNLISIDRLKKLDRPLIYNFVIYNSLTKVIIKNFCLEVYELNWDYLSIQNLGAGQLQITNMVAFLSNPKTTMNKEQWLTKLQLEAVKFYDKLIVKTQARKQSWQ